jgi:PadR family transcriptional regulator PadR
LSTRGPKNKPARGKRAAAARRAASEATQAAEGLDNLSAQARKGFESAGRPSDVFGGELPFRGAESGGPRRRDMFSLLVLHLISVSEQGASYGNQLIERIETMTRGVVVLNPNTMYPLLRELETRGLIEGRWEHPEKRSRRLYSLTGDGHREYDHLRETLEPFLDSIVEGIQLIKREVYGAA